MQQQQHKLSTLMRMSWQIQKRKNTSRSKSLQSAWAITSNEDITVYYLVKKHSNHNAKHKVDSSNLTLFKQH